MKYYPNYMCNQPTWYDNLVHPTMLCAGHSEGGKGTCQVDYTPWISTETRVEYVYSVVCTRTYLSTSQSRLTATGLTCHVASRSVPCHPAEVTSPPLPQLVKAGGTQ